MPQNLASYMAYKSSVAFNGVSLTVNQVNDHPKGLSKGQTGICEISVNLITHTVQNTTLGDLRTNSPVNLEVDTVARYVQRMLSINRNGN